MKIITSPTQPNNNLAFKSNKLAFFALEKIADHSATFITGASFVGATVLRPLAISLTPKVDKENKKYAKANSLASGIMKLAIAESISLPVENAIKKIEKNPQNFLNQKTLKNFSKNENNFKFLSQTIKQGTNFLTAIPKSYLTVALIPIFMDKFFNKKEPSPKNSSDNFNNSLFSKNEKNFPAFQNISFKGDILANGISKIINNENLQNFSKKHNNSNNLTRNMTIATDLLLTATTVLKTKTSKKIKEERKKPLIYNNILSTLASILFSCSIDKLIQNSTKNSIETFKNKHSLDPKLSKYIDGINVLRPTIVFALVYYGILPIATTFLADKIDKLNKTKSQE